MKRFLVEDDAIDNPKLMLLSAEAFRFWFQCLCVANRHVPRGGLPEVAVIAFRARLSVEQAESLLATLVAARLIDRDGDGRLGVHDWDDYQHNERDWAAIKRAQRAKKKDVSKDCPRGRPRGQAQDVSNGVHAVSTPKGIKEESPTEISPSQAQEKSPSSIAADRMPYDDCVDLTRTLFDETQARTLEMQGPEVAQQIGHRWDCYAAALRHAHASLQRTGAKPIGNLVAFCVDKARKFVAGGVPPEPAEVRPARRPEPPEPKLLDFSDPAVKARLFKGA